MTFADFLEVMHVHSRVENLPKEIVDAFKAADPEGTGTITAKHLRHLLQNWGERLSSKEVDRIFREANVNNNSLVKYEDFVKIACAPVPDYYWRLGMSLWRLFLMYLYTSDWKRIYLPLFLLHKNMHLPCIAVRKARISSYLLNFRRILCDVTIV